MSQKTKTIHPALSPEKKEAIVQRPEYWVGVFAAITDLQEAGYLTCQAAGNAMRSAVRGMHASTSYGEPPSTFHPLLQ